MMYLMAPLSLTGSRTGSQFLAPRSLFCWRVKPVEGEGHETVRALPGPAEMLREGGGGSYCTVPLIELTAPWSSRAVTVRELAPTSSGTVKLMFGLAPQLLQTVTAEPPFN